MTTGGGVVRVRLDPAAGPPTVGRWLLAQTAVVVGGGCVALHVGSALAPGSGSWPVRALLMAMAGACLPCLRALSRAPTRRVWASTGAMYGAMLTVHLVLMAPRSTVGMHHGAVGLTWAELGMWAFVVLASTQLLLVAVALRWAGRSP